MLVNLVWEKEKEGVVCLGEGVHLGGILSSRAKFGVVLEEGFGLVEGCQSRERGC